MYSFVIYIYVIGVRIASLFSKKVRLMVNGHRQTFKILREQIKKDEKYIWFHAASLGEFEQGRPMMERVRKEHPEFKILLTFFSPSGYEVRKNYDGADVICYLPLDTPTNVHRFFKCVKPEMAFFIKYEFWQNYLKKLQKLGIPTYSVSSIFRRNQVFFRWYGGRYHKVLTRFTHLFVQNEESKHLLATLGINNVTVVGDTRCDRVIDIFREAKQLPIVEAFKQSQKTFVVGSSWGPDEDIYIPYFNNRKDVKLIIAPHVISEDHLREIEGKLQMKSIRYTEATEENVKDAQCLIINCFGLLSSIYRYGEVAYVGGGFGVGIHNVPEAAVYSIPVIIGPNNKRFQEAQHLLKIGGCFEITDSASFLSIIGKLLDDEAFCADAGAKAGKYIRESAGASDAVFKSVFN